MWSNLRFSESPFLLRLFSTQSFIAGWSLVVSAELTGNVDREKGIGFTVFLFLLTLNPYKTCSQHQRVNLLTPVSSSQNTSRLTFLQEMSRTACGTCKFLETLQLNLRVSNKGNPIKVSVGPVLLFEKICSI